MIFNIFRRGEKINTIVATEEFVSEYCAQTGNTYEIVVPVDEKHEPTTEELLNILLGVTE